MSDHDLRKWTFQVSTFVGVLSYAEHYLGFLRAPDKRANPNIIGGEYGYPPQPEAVSYVLDEATAKRLSTDDFKYRAGWDCEKFFSNEAAIEALKKRFLEIAEPGDYLVGYINDLTDDEPTVLARKEA